MLGRCRSGRSIRVARFTVVRWSGRVVERPEIHLETRAQWRAWLQENHDRVDGIWLVSWRNGHGPRIPYSEIAEEALCFGWIDGQLRTIDDARSALRLTPRRKGSTWARSNKERVERLRAAGLMQPSGEAVIERAIADGTWTILDDVENLVVPDDLAASLAAAGATAAFAALPPGRRKQSLWWVTSARRPATRQARISAVTAEVADAPGAAAPTD